MPAGADHNISCLEWGKIKDFSLTNIGKTSINRFIGQIQTLIYEIHRRNF
jgi:hypothetical protein